MASGDLTVPECPVENPALDPESATWVRGLGGSGPAYNEAVARLHELQLRVARGEVRRRRGQLAIAGPELHDLAHQAAADAVVGVTAKIAQFRGREPVHHRGLQVRHLRGVDQDRPPLLAEADGAHGRRGLGPAA